MPIVTTEALGNGNLTGVRRHAGQHAWLAGRGQPASGLPPTNCPREHASQCLAR
jgi:hypothetical protein